MNENLIKRGLVNPFSCTKNYALCPKCCNENPAPVELLDLSAGKEREVVCDEATILYVRQGSVCLLSSRQNGLLMKEGQLLFLSPGERFCVKAEENGHLLMWRINEVMLLFEYLKLDTQEPVSESNQDELITLDAQQHIRNMLTQFTLLIEEGVSCPAYIKGKLEELLILMRMFYPKDLLTHFFQTLQIIDYAFKKTILLQHANARTVEELASIVNLSRSGFHQHFKKVVGKSPSRWMNEVKAQQVLYELTVTLKPIKQIWIEQGFSSASYFNQFCKKYLGNTPARIRKG